MKLIPSIPNPINSIEMNKFFLFFWKSRFPLSVGLFFSNINEEKHSTEITKVSMYHSTLKKDVVHVRICRVRDLSIIGFPFHSLQLQIVVDNLN